MTTPRGARLLISSQLETVVGHVYLARRHAARGQAAKADIDWAANMLSGVMEDAARERLALWMPMLLLTHLDRDGGQEVQTIIRRHTTDAAAIHPLDKFEAGQEGLFFGVWIMSAENPDCERLMELH